MRYGKDKEVEIFKALATKSTYKVGLDYNFDKVYTNSRAVRNAVMSIFTKIKNNPEKFGVGQEVVDMVVKGMEVRRIERHPANQPSMVEKQEGLADIKQVVTNIRDKTFNLIDRKLDRISNSRKKLDALSFKELGVIAGIAFDKTQILKGEATENIAVMAKIDKNITPEEAIEQALKFRESNVEKYTNK